MPSFKSILVIAVIAFVVMVIVAKVPPLRSLAS